MRETKLNGLLKKGEEGMSGGPGDGCEGGKTKRSGGKTQTGCGTRKSEDLIESTLCDLPDFRDPRPVCENLLPWQPATRGYWLSFIQMAFLSH